MRDKKGRLIQKNTHRDIKPKNSNISNKDSGGDLSKSIFDEKF